MRYADGGGPAASGRLRSETAAVPAGLDARLARLARLGALRGQLADRSALPRPATVTRHAPPAAER
ncbi:hypothetical protein ACFV6F_19475 [Kitasatospora phosalacinea]|uniref:hypothetical protein n=1 Tax=Kitasatospora phosalacinea TaxID=2065 RepID=UPI0036680153